MLRSTHQTETTSNGVSVTEEGPSSAGEDPSMPWVARQRSSVKDRIPVAVRLPLTARLDRSELRRRLWHMAPGLLPFVLWFFPHSDPMSPRLRTIVILIAVVLATSIYRRFRMIARHEELDDGTVAVFGYAGSVLAAVLLFPAHIELGLTVLGIVAFGDGSATLGGLLLDGPRLPWNREKTWAGLLTFLLIGTPMAALIFWGEPYHNPEALGTPVAFSTALICAGAAVLASAISESLPSRVNDNLRVGVTAAVALAVLQSVMVGWG